MMERFNKIIISIILGLWILSGAVSCSSDPQPEETNYIGVREPYEEPASNYVELFFKMRGVDILKNMNKASLSLLNSVLRETGGKENFCFSTYGVNSMLASMTEGTTAAIKDEILRYFNYSDSEVIRDTYSIFRSYFPTLDNQVDFISSNSLWVDEMIGSTFSEGFIQEGLGTEVYKVKFGTKSVKDMINSWFGENTRGRVGEFLSKYPEGHISISSAGYVKGKWNMAFDRESIGRFQGVSNSSDVEMMHITKRLLGYAEGENWQGVILSFGNVNYVLRLILPNEGVGIMDVTGLDKAVWKACSYVGVSMPKFEIEYKNDNFKAALQQSGITEIFSPTGWNQFGENKEEGSAFIDNWMLGAGIVIDGTLAKTASYSYHNSGLPTYYYPPVEFIDKDVELVFNRPFIYEIREHSTDTILFMGVVNDL